MGISSNQARLMTLTARQHDLELRAQQISAQKMIKGLESQEAAMNYSKALNNYTLIDKLYKEAGGYEPVAPKGYHNGWAGPYYKFNYDNNTWEKSDTYSQEYNINHYHIYEELYNNLGCDSVAPSSFMIPVYDQFGVQRGAYPDKTTPEEYLQLAKAQYDEFTASVSTEEKLLDMELTQINTEHSAVKTEYDSVKGLVGENVDKSFNVFS